MLFVASLNILCQSVGLSLKECMTSGLTHVQRFSGLTRNFEKFLNAVQNFSAAQTIVILGHGHKCQVAATFG